MPRLDYKTCKHCGRAAAEVGALSHTRLCAECWEQRKRENNLSLVAKRGAPFRYWRQQVAASVGGVLLDDLRDGA